jgi:hypothetical protein
MTSVIPILDSLGFQIASAEARSDGDILPLDIAGFLETFTEGGHQERVSPGRSAAEESDHRQRRLLRALGLPVASYHPREWQISGLREPMS